MTDARLAGIEAEVLASATSSVRLAGAVVEVLFDTVHIPVSEARVAGVVVEALAAPDADARLGGMVVETLVQEVTSARLGATLLEVLATAPPTLPGDFDGSLASTRGPFLYAVPMLPDTVEGDPTGYQEPMVPLASFTLNHELTASSLPGQVHAPAGLAVASGSLTFAQPPAWETDPVVTPWGGETLWTDIGQFSVWAIAEEPSTLADLLANGGEIARCVGRPLSGALTEVGLKVEWDQIVEGRDQEAVWVDWPRVSYSHSPDDDVYTLGTLLSQAFPWALTSPAQVATDWPEPMTTPGLEAAGMTVGEVLRTYVEPLCGAAVADIVTGKFRLFTRTDLIGGRGNAEVISVADQLNDIRWVTDPSEIREAVSVSYRLVKWEFSSADTELWKASGPLLLPTFQTVSISNPVGYATAFTIIHPNRDGTGDRLGSLSTATETIPGTWLLTFDDTSSSSTVSWAVNDDGQPSARLNTKWPGTYLDRTVHVGNAPLITDYFNFDGGPAVQTPATAVAVASFLQGLLSVRRWTIDRVQVVVDLRRRVGDVIKLVYDDDDRDVHLAARGIITGITLDYDSTGLQQYLSVAICPSTLGDIDAHLNAHGVGTTLGDFDDFLDAEGVGSTLGDIDDYPWERA